MKIDSDQRFNYCPKLWGEKTRKKQMKKKRPRKSHWKKLRKKRAVSQRS